jgi:transposase-like protein
VSRRCFKIKVGDIIGSKGKYREWLEPDKLFLVQNWKKSGLTDKQICEKIGITTSTFHDWIKKFTQFSEALKKGKEFSDFEVENALFKNATGYFQKVTKVHKLKTVKVIENKRIEVEELIEKEEDVFVQPQTAAQIFWLKNRKSNTWKNNPVSSEDEVVINPFAGLSNEDLIKLTNLNLKGDKHD